MSSNSDSQRSGAPRHVERRQVAGGGRHGHAASSRPVHRTAGHERAASYRTPVHHIPVSPAPEAPATVSAEQLRAVGAATAHKSHLSHAARPAHRLRHRPSIHGLKRRARAIRGKNHLHKISAFAKTMFRLRHYIQFTIVIACLSWGGYQVTRSVLAQPTEQNTSAATVTQDGQTLDSKYPGLPTAVAAAVKSVVATQRITSGNGADTQNGLAGSGVVISNTEILTAGHNVEDGKGLACSQTLVVSPGVLSAASATKDLVTHASVEYGKDDDIAVLTVNPSANFRELPDIKLAKATAQPGETVYFINFQPAADGKGRTPLASDKAYSEPVIFSATALGVNDHGLAIAAGGGKSFGLGVPDVMLRKGASGGAVVNAKGELLGLSVSSQSLAADRSASSLLKEYDVNLNAGNYQVVYMQPSTQSIVSRLQSGMVSCAGSD